MIRPEHAASIRVAERLDETLENRLEIMGGEALIFGIPRTAWKQHKA